MLVEDTVTPVGALPIAQFKDHLRLGSGFAEDGIQDVILESFLRAALAAVEARTGKTLLERAFTWTVSEVAHGDKMSLPVAPVKGVTEMAIGDGAATFVVIDPAQWFLVADSQVPQVVAKGGSLPLVSKGGLLRLRFVAGFGPDWSDVPADLQQAVMMLAAHYYEFRHEMGLGAGCMPFGVTALIERYRNIRLFGGRV